MNLDNFIVEFLNISKERFGLLADKNPEQEWHNFLNEFYSQKSTKNQTTASLKSKMSELLDQMSNNTKAFEELAFKDRGQRVEGVSPLAYYKISYK